MTAFNPRVLEQVELLLNLNSAHTQNEAQMTVITVGIGVGILLAM
jgi:hypothetical protein